MIAAGKETLNIAWSLSNRHICQRFYDQDFRLIHSPILLSLFFYIFWVFGINQNIYLLHHSNTPPPKKAKKKQHENGLVLTPQVTWTCKKSLEPLRGAASE